jgi:cytoskeletal protein CcmA (bactofilin family)
MFNTNHKSQRREVAEQPADTIVSSGTTLEGKVRVEGTVRIDGRIEGSIFVNGLLLVGAGAEIQAEVEAVQARVAGRIRGNLKARESVELLEGSRLEGDVFTKCFRIEDGAFFQGNCHMGEAWVGESPD